jgi:two-component system, LuxR family, response regulator FixJ
VPLDDITVYLVDDDDAVRDSLKLLLESYGMAVRDYASTEAFVRAYRPQAQACLVLDQHLPGATGLDFLASAAGARLGVPVILVTGRGDAAIRARALDAGVVAYFEKPIDDGALVDAIARAIDGRA